MGSIQDIPFVSTLYEMMPHVDFEGQKFAEKLFKYIILLFGVVGFVWGYICQQFSQTVYVFGAGFLLACLTLLAYILLQKGLGTRLAGSPMVGTLINLIRGLIGLVLPPWPMFRRHPLQWLPSKDGKQSGSASTTAGGSKSGRNDSTKQSKQESKKRK